jgi:acetyl esterase
VSLHPEVESIVRAARAADRVHPSTESIADRRRDYRELATALWPEPTAMAEVRSVSLATEPALPGRLYVPSVDEGCGLIVYFHGGSFVVGDLETHDGLCRRLAADTRMRLLAVDYRLAPEHPFPAAVDDAVAAARYVAGHVGEFANPSARVILVGDSAGGTLAALAASATRHEGLPIAAQALLYPSIGPELLTNSAHQFATGYLLEVEHLRYDYEQYLGGFRDHGDPRVSPLMSLDLAGSPPAVVVVAQFDPLRDEAVAYAGLLEHFGVTVELLEAEGMVHGFLRLGGVIPDAMAIVDDLAGHLHRFVEDANA